MRKPSLFAMFLLLFGLVFFTNLAFWQLRRADEKTQILNNYADRSSLVHSSLEDAIADLQQRARYVPNFVEVRLRGRFVSGKTLLLDSQRSAGKIGVQIYQAFQPEGAPRAVLVGMGFQAIKPDRSEFPSFATPTGDWELRGLLSGPPSSGLQLTDQQLVAPASSEWLVNRILPGEQAAYFAVPLAPFVLLLDPEQPTTHAADFVGGLPEVMKLPRQWNPAIYLTPEKHRGYALTWFGFALTSVIIFFLLHRRKV